MMAVAVAEAIEDPVEKKKTWKLVSADSEEAGEGPARMAIDGDSYTFWHTNYSEKETKHPHEIVVDMGREEKITAFRHLPRQDGGVNGRVRAYEVYFSKDGVEWGEPVLKGEIKNVGGWSMLPLATAVTARFFKFRALSEWHNGPWTSVGEFDIRRAIGF
jgi:beta-galactosidase